MSDEVPIVIFNYESNIGQEFEATEYVLGDLRAKIVAKDFIILKQDVAGDQYIEVALAKAFPDWIIAASARDNNCQNIGVEDDSHGLFLMNVRRSAMLLEDFLFRQPFFIPYLVGEIGGLVHEILRQ